MHPYMLEKLAAARRDDYLSVAERHRLLVRARRGRAKTGRRERVGLPPIPAAVSRSSVQARTL